MSLKIKRKVTIEDFAEFFGKTFDFTGWKFEEMDLEKFTKIENVDDIELLNPARGRGETTGSDALFDLDNRVAVILLGPEEFLAFMEDRESIPISWEDTDGGEIIYVRFYRRVLTSPSGKRFVPTIFFYAGQFLPDIQCLDDIVDGTEKAAVIGDDDVDTSEDDGEDDGSE